MSNQFLIIKQEYVELVQAKCQQLNKRTVECAAKLIHYFQNWASWKKTTHRTEWIYQKLRQIYDDFFQLHSMHQIRAAIASLMDAGILERRNNPGNGQDKTFQYRLNLPDSKLEPESSDLNSQDSTVENHTYNQYKESNLKTVPKPELGEREKEKEEISQEKLQSDYAHDQIKSTSGSLPEDSGEERSSVPCSTEEVFLKYEDKLKLYGIYLSAWQGSQRIPNPKLKNAIALSQKLSRDKLERILNAFLVWARETKDVRDIYGALTASISRNWQV
jgi:hypothetical protein